MRKTFIPPRRYVEGKRRNLGRRTVIPPRRYVEGERRSLEERDRVRRTTNSARIGPTAWGEEGCPRCICWNHHRCRERISVQRKNGAMGAQRAQHEHEDATRSDSKGHMLPTSRRNGPIVSVKAHSPPTVHRNSRVGVSKSDYYRAAPVRHRW